jgi:hypothetical protein
LRARARLAAMVFGCIALPAAAETGTETVLVTHRVRAGEEAAYAAILDRKWATLRRLELALARPHLILQGTDESGGTVFVEVFTWRNHDAPDNAPPEVVALWRELQARAEKRLGHRAIEFRQYRIDAAD